MKIAMELAREEAIEAKQQKERINKLNAQKQKVEGEMRLESLAEEKEEDAKVKVQIVDMIHAQRHQAAEKVEDVKKDNRRIRDEIHQEISEALQ